MFLALPAGQLAVVPGSSHAVPIEKPADVARLVVDFLSSGPPETFMPILRAASTS
jgi:pimeloyl-ACP methyl ester carboxylesterase